MSKSDSSERPAQDAQSPEEATANPLDFSKPKPIPQIETKSAEENGRVLHRQKGKARQAEEK